MYLVTVRGRKSGQPHSTPVVIVEQEGKQYLLSPFGVVNWVRNLRACSDVRVRVGGAEFEGRARVVDASVEPTLATAVRALSEAKYGWGDGLGVELAPALPR